MALPELITRLDNEAQLRVEAIRKEAAAQIAAIDEATEAAARETVSTHLERQRACRRAAHDQALAAARRTERARALEVTRALVRRILDRAQQLEADAAASPEYAAALPTHAAEALSFVEGLRPTVRCASRYAALVQGAVAQHPDATLVIDDTVRPGVIADAADGSVTVDNTLGARLARREPDLATALARRVRDGCD